MRVKCLAQEHSTVSPRLFCKEHSHFYTSLVCGVYMFIIVIPYKTPFSQANMNYSRLIEKRLAYKRNNYLASFCLV